MRAGHGGYEHDQRPHRGHGRHELRLDSRSRIFNLAVFRLVLFFEFSTYIILEPVLKGTKKSTLLAFSARRVLLLLRARDAGCTHEYGPLILVDAIELGGAAAPAPQLSGGAWWRLRGVRRQGGLQGNKPRTPQCPPASLPPPPPRQLCNRDHHPVAQFNAAHFVAFEGYRERLHGHNYMVSVRLTGKLCRDGYVVDFGDIKKYTRGICKELNEHFICPCASDVLRITSKDRQVTIECPDGTYFSFPRSDCAMLPIAHSTAEEMAVYIWQKLLEQFGTVLVERGVTIMEVNVSEMPRQAATFRHRIPRAGATAHLDREVATPSPSACCAAHSVGSSEEATAADCGGAGVGGADESGPVLAQGAHGAEAEGNGGGNAEAEASSRPGGPSAKRPRLP